MAARDGMTNIILHIRRNTDTENIQEDVDGVVYWTDDQLQDVADRHSRDVIEILLSPVTTHESGNTVFKKYFFPDRVPLWIEGTETTGAFKITDLTGVEITTGFTVDLSRRLSEFTASTGGDNYLLTCRAFLMNDILAEIWRTKASLRARLVQARMGANAINEDQEYMHCLRMAEKFAGRTLRSFRMMRTGYA